MVTMPIMVAGDGDHDSSHDNERDCNNDSDDDNDNDHASYDDHYTTGCY